MSLGIREVRLAEQPAIAIRESVPVARLPEFFGRAFGVLMEYAGRHGAEFAGHRSHSTTRSNPRPWMWKRGFR